MLPILDIKQIHKYLDIGGGHFDKITECFGDITCLYGRTDRKIPFLVKFIEDHTISIKHGMINKTFKFTEDNYPLK